MKTAPLPERVKRLKNTSANKAKIKKDTTLVDEKKDVTCPEWLSKDAKEEWQRIAPALIKNGLLTPLNRTAFVVYCQTFAKWQQLEIVIDSSGLVLDREAGKVSPLLQASMRLLVQLNVYGSKFGLSPADQPRVASSTGLTDEENEFDIFLRSK